MFLTISISANLVAMRGKMGIVRTGDDVRDRKQLIVGEAGLLPKLEFPLTREDYLRKEVAQLFVWLVGDQKHQQSPPAASA